MGEKDGQRLRKPQRERERGRERGPGRSRFLYLLVGVRLWFLVGGATPLKGGPLAESKNNQNIVFLIKKRKKSIPVWFPIFGFRIDLFECVCECVCACLCV